MAECELINADAIVTLRACDYADMVYLDPPFGHGEFGTFSVDKIAKCIDLAWSLIQPNGIVYLHADPELLYGNTGLIHHPLRGVIVWKNGWISGFKSKSTRFWPRQYQVIAGFAASEWRWRRQERAKPEGYSRRGGGGGTGFVLSDWWDDITPVDQASFSREKVGWPTQKPLKLLERLIAGSTDVGALVVDPFMGSGTSAVASQRLGRHFVGGDVNPESIRITTERLNNG